MEVSAGSPHNILRWVGRLRDGRTFGQVHTVRLVRRRHGHPHLFPASWPCLGWCSLLCSVKWALYPRAEFTWHPRPPLASLAVHRALAHPQWGGLQLWGKGSCSRAPGSLLSTYLFHSPRFPSPFWRRQVLSTSAWHQISTSRGICFNHGHHQPPRGLPPWLHSSFCKP